MGFSQPGSPADISGQLHIVPTSALLGSSKAPETVVFSTSPSDDMWWILAVSTFHAGHSALERILQNSLSAVRHASSCWGCAGVERASER